MIEIGIGILGGLVIGATGAGTGSLVTPLLILAGYRPLVAIGTGVGSLFLSKLTGSITHCRLGHWPGRAGWYVVGGGIAGAIAVGLLAAAGESPGIIASDVFVKRLLGVIMLIATAALTAASRAKEKNEGTSPPPRPLALFGAGFTVSPIVAITSAGSGSLLVTLLLFLTAWRVPALAATSNLFGSVVGAAGLVLHWQMHGFDMNLFALVMAGLAPGVIVGAFLSRVVSREILVYAVYLLTICLGVALLA